MTRDQILAADPVTLTVEAHRILGRTIKYSCYHAGVGNELNCDWEMADDNGNRLGYLEDPDGCQVTAQVLSRLGAKHYAYSWDAARELWEHEKWPKDHWISMEDAKTYLAKGALIDAMFPRYDEGPCLRESSLPPLITRVFVLANHQPEVPDA